MRSLVLSITVTDKLVHILFRVMNIGLQVLWLKLLFIEKPQLSYIAVPERTSFSHYAALRTWAF